MMKRETKELCSCGKHWVPSTLSVSRAHWIPAWVVAAWSEVLRYSVWILACVHANSV